MKPTDTNAKSGSLLDGELNGDCKNSKDIYKMLNLIQDAQNYVEALRINGPKVTEEKKDYGNRPK